MAEYIDLDTPFEAYRLHGNQYEPISTTLRELLDFNKIPYTVADVAPVRRGRWIKSEIPDEKYVCSECGGACWYYDYEGEVARSRYCPNCGAKMDGESTVEEGEG